MIGHEVIGKLQALNKAWLDRLMYPEVLRYWLIQKMTSGTI